jgi:hypothetical protein
VIVLIGFGFGGLQVGHLETFTYRKLVTADGRDAQWKQITAKGGGTSYQVVAKGTTKPIQQWKMVYTLHPPADNEDDSPFGYRNLNQQEKMRWFQFLIISGAAAGLGLVAGILMVVFLWHWKKRRYVLGTLLPFAAAAFVIGVYFIDDDYDPVRSYAVRITIGYALWQAAWMAIGALIGRPIMRGILRTLIPPNPRQHFNFLWHADGKTPPPAKPIVATA